MQSKKRVMFLISSSLLILLLIPNSFALFEWFNYGSTYTQDPLQIYTQFQGWIDFILFSAIFIILFMFLLEKVFGAADEEKKALVKKLAAVLGISAALGISYYGRHIGGPQEGLLISLAPFWLILLMTLLVYSVYKTFSSNTENKPMTIGTGILLLIISLFLLSLWLPNIFGSFTELLLRLPFVPILILGLMVIGTIALLLWLFGIGSKAFSQAGSPSADDQEIISQEQEARQSQREQEDPEPPQQPKEEKLVVDISITPSPDPETKTYKPGDRISLIAQVYEKKWFSKRRASDDFACIWKVGGKEQEGHSTTEEYKIPLNIYKLKDSILIEVLVQDTNNRLRSGKASVLIKVSADIPVLRIIKPIDTATTKDLVIERGQVLEFDYRMENLSPPEVADATWLYLKGAITNLSEKVLRKASMFDTSKPLDLEPGVYTIVCVAIDNNGRFYIFRITNKLLVDSFMLNIKPKPEEQRKILLKDLITKPTTREESRRKPYVLNYNTDIKLKAEDIPQEITKIEWDLHGEHIETPSANQIRKLGEGAETSTLFLYDENMVIGILPEGDYTIFAYGYKGKDLVAIDYIWINLVNVELRRKGPPQPPPKRGQPHQPLFLLLYKQDPATKKGKHIQTYSENAKFDAKVGEIYAFKPAVTKEDNITYYDTVIEISTRGDKFHYDPNTRTASLIITAPGEKQVACIFRKDNKILEKIEVTVNATPKEKTSGDVELTVIVSKADPKKGPQIMGNFNEDFRIEDAKVNETYVLRGVIEGSHVEDYTINMVNTVSSFGEFRYDPKNYYIGSLVIEKPGEKRILIRLIKNGKTIKTIIGTINVS